MLVPRRRRLARHRRRSRCDSPCTVQRVSSLWKARHRPHRSTTWPESQQKETIAAIHRWKRAYLDISKRMAGIWIQTCKNLSLVRLNRLQEHPPERNRVKVRYDGLLQSRDRIWHPYQWRNGAKRYESAFLGRIKEKEKRRISGKCSLKR